MAKRKPAPKTRHKDTPAWLAAADLFDGEWMNTPKLPLRAFIRPEIVELKVNVLGVLFIHTFGYETELAVVMRKLRRFESYEESNSLYRRYEKENGVLVTEVMTSNSIATKLFEYWMEDYQQSGYSPSKQQLAEMKKARQQLRKVFEVLEADGWIERARLNCKPQQLVGLGYENAVTKGLLTPLHVLKKTDPLALKKLGGERKEAKVGIFLLAKPRPAKTYGRRGDVAVYDYIRPDKSNDFNAEASANQLFLDLGNEFGVASETLKAHPELRGEVTRYVTLQEKAQRDEDARKRQELKIRGMVELIARQQGSTLSGSQRPLNFNSKVSASPNSNSQFPSVKAGTIAPVEGRETSVSKPGAAAGEAEKVSTPLNPNGKERPTERTVSSTSGPSPESHSGAAVASRRGVEKVSEADAHQVLEAMHRFGQADLDGARQVIALCRDKRPQATAVEIVENIRIKLPTVRVIETVVGFCKTAIPKMFEGPERKAPQSWHTTCASCGKPITGMAINGNCADCVQARLSSHGD